MEEEETSAIPDTEWQSRVLCSDESCIGVIGPDGRCKECGRAYEGPLPLPVPFSADAEPFLENATNVEDASSDEAEDGDPEWEERRLCSDENCIGVIGPDGRCKECGRQHDL